MPLLRDATQFELDGKEILDYALATDGVYDPWFTSCSFLMEKVVDEGAIFMEDAIFVIAFHDCFRVLQQRQTDIFVSKEPFKSDPMSYFLRQGTPWEKQFNTFIGYINRVTECVDKTDRGSKG